MTSKESQIMTFTILINNSYLAVSDRSVTSLNAVRAPVISIVGLDDNGM